MAGAGDEDGGKPRPTDDAFEDVTAPYHVDERSTEDDATERTGSPDADPLAADTTTWAEAQAPPVLIEEETVLVHTPDAGSPTERAAPSAELDATVVDAPDAAEDPTGQVAQDAVEDATVVAVLDDFEDATVVTTTDVVEDATVVAAPNAAEDASVVATSEAASSPIEETPTVVYAEDRLPLDSASAGGLAAEADVVPETVLEPIDEAAPEAEFEPIAEPEPQLQTPTQGQPEPAAAATTMSSAADEAATRIERTSTDARGTIPPSSSLHPMLLERVEPSLGRGERLRLDAAHWHVRLGRAEQNEVRLYTAAASREHAEIRGNEHGEWVLTPGAGKSLLVDGAAISEPIVLEVGMNLVMGGDHLRCVTEGLARSEMAAQTAVDGMLDDDAGEGVAPLVPWLIGGIALLAIAVFVLVWFSA